MVCWVYWASTSRAFQPGELHRTREGCRNGHARGHFYPSCCSWSPTPGIRPPTPLKVLPGCLSLSGGCGWRTQPHWGQTTHPPARIPFLQSFLLVFPIQEGVSHVYYLFQLFLPYKSNKKGQQCYFTLFASLMLKSLLLWFSWLSVIDSIENSYLTGRQDLSPEG